MQWSIVGVDYAKEKNTLNIKKIHEITSGPAKYGNKFSGRLFHALLKFDVFSKRGSNRAKTANKKYI
tara:strand:+ start:166 stop:366 length:201 start_codon:yes stop_codon:yes gene_type:complete